jgi:uncharacterized protein YbjQ (UPF0145 family)
MNDVLLTTTPVIQGREIQQYYGLVTVRNVRAMNIIRDILTSIRDIFGGRSGAYQEVMDDVERELLEELKAKAAQMGANAIIGLQIDYENVGAKNNSLIMAFAKGTAVRI